ncbi:hypothetical protein GPECTOR_30g145 [Gonium pectorale]|uniref:Uncharacterized protein n=1 Tax=Gonium pectorale TaxID=33097 RepID=A0A150GFE7_GONPE|nr:hypothetical protein GPECTOR_30g145 [Gonium pectorale]|eukprot:KXZ48050.1 hypothetical protein GPECTOR_30g145 [Gonium pectorale]
MAPEKQHGVSNSVVVLGVTAMAFSGDGERLAVCGDEPDCSVIVYAWRKRDVLGRARLPPSSPACLASFHPLDPAILATTGAGGLAVWYLEALWDRTVFRPQHLPPASLPPGHHPTVHAWCPHGGLYVGTSGGALALLDLATMAPMQLSCIGSGGADVCGAPAAHSAAASSVLLTDTVGPGAGVAALALNRDHVAVTGTDGSVHVWSQTPLVGGCGPPAFSHEVWLGRGGATGVAVSAAEVGGPEHATLILGCPDGTLFRAGIAPHAGAGVAARAGYTLATPAADFHVGRLAGVAAHPAGGAFVTAGADGSVRMWGAADGALLGRKALGSAQCAVMMLRRVELAEHRALSVVPYQFMFRGTGIEGLNDPDDDGASADGPTGSGASASANAAAAAAMAAAAAAAAAAAMTGNDPDSLMYSDFDLHCSTRKALQVHLIKQKIRDLKAAFNTDFARVQAQKRTDSDRIADLYARLEDTCKDLRKLGAGHLPVGGRVPPRG